MRKVTDNPTPDAPVYAPVDPPRTVAETPWLCKGYGNHRAVLRVDQAAQAVRATIPWRRRDTHPERIGLRVIRLDDGAEVENILPLSFDGTKSERKRGHKSRDRATRTATRTVVP